MEDDFYRGRLRDRHGIDVAVPDADGRALVHRVIYEELCRGVVDPASKARVLAVIDRARADAADGVILGCTELGMLLGPADSADPVLDTTRLHVEAALDFALAA